MAELAAASGFELSELMGGKTSLKGVKAWAGRGRQPRWLVAALKKGTKLESFAVYFESCRLVVVGLEGLRRLEQNGDLLIIIRLLASTRCSQADTVTRADVESPGGEIPPGDSTDSGHWQRRGRQRREQQCACEAVPPHGLVSP